VRKTLALVALSLVTLAGCATARSRADDAFQRGDYVGAADRYEAIVAKNPKDGEARGRLVDARARAVSVLLAAIDADMSARRTDDALTKLRDLLTLRTRWDLELETSVAARVANDVAWASTVIRSEVSMPLAAGRPLLAEAAMARRASLTSFVDFGGL
jgi:hypothetical protein